ncbi:MAG: leucine-rich repeat domain-containing protein [Clostridiales bacterium]|jgi:Leucine-rich repeat (LRR) protein|nr:leucine-rich repeat domain-containing protein [Clostridiales bacterium]
MNRNTEITRQKFIVCLLIIFSLTLSACGNSAQTADPADQSADTVGVISLEAYDGWWYMPEDYEDSLEGIVLIKIFRLNSANDEFIVYDEFANAAYSGPAAADWEGNLVLSVDVLGDITLISNGTDELYGEDGKLAFTRGDEFTPPDLGLAANWYLYGDTDSDYYTLNGDNTFSLYSAGLDSVTEEGDYTLSRVSSHFGQGEPVDIIHIEMNGKEALLSSDSLIFVVEGAFDAYWYMREDAIGSPEGDAAMTNNDLIINDWYSDDGELEFLFSENNSFAYRIKDEEGWFADVSRTGGWQIEDDGLALIWDDGNAETAELFTNPTSFFVPSLDQGFATTAGASRRNQDEEVYTLGGKDFSASVRALDLRTAYVDDISILADCADLEELDLSYTYVTDISPLAGLVNLKKLDLERLGLSDISDLASLTQLEDLMLRGNPIEDYSILANFPNLTALGVDEADFADISPYVDVNGLTSLVATNCGISDLTMLSGSVGLETLMIDENPLDNDDLTALTGMVNLDSLWIGGTRIDDVSALAPLTNLTYLSLYGSDITNVKGCEQLSFLKELELLGSGIDDINFLKDIADLEYIGLSAGITDISVLKDLPNLDYVSFYEPPESMWPDIRELEEKGVSVAGMPFEYYDE